MSHRINKIGFIGNACTGKTTAMFALMSHMKICKLRVGYVSDLSRSITFHPNVFDVNPAARLHILFKQMAAEQEQETRKDVDFILTERTAMDWYLYYRWTCNKVGRPTSIPLEAMVRDYFSTYDLLFYLSDKGITYVADGFRPATGALRDDISKSYRALYRMIRDKKCTPVALVDHPSVAERRDYIIKVFDKWVKGANLPA
jgi:hypothetical protein